MSSFSIAGQLVDLHQRRIYPAEIIVQQGRIRAIQELREAPARYLLPGFIDAHVHIESSMLAPAAFAQMAVVHGTIASVSDPHEIANVCGEEGVQWMIRNASITAFKAYFGAPSCVPATDFETAGATLDAEAIDRLMQSPDIWYLSEMMNYPGVLQGAPEIVAKIEAAKRQGKPVDGHAPGLRGAEAARYAAAGISTDHECTSLEEALDKIAAGMHILIREGSAAKNFEALHLLLAQHPDRVMLCSDDKHPDDLAVGHINSIVQRALDKGHELFDVLRAACVNPALHYRLPVGLLRAGDPADFQVLHDLENWHPSQVYINGVVVADEGMCKFEITKPDPINRFNAQPRNREDFGVTAVTAHPEVRVIQAHDGQLTTTSFIARLSSMDGWIQTDIAQDVLKLAVINRYEPQALPALAFIKGFGFKRGAIASTVAHDCHNIIAVGADDAEICAAVNAVIAAKGGVSVAMTGDEVYCLPLPIAGLMSADDGQRVASQYAALSTAAKSLGSDLAAPFMTLSFMALLVIPALKLSDRGLFDGTEFRFTDVVL